MKLWLVRHAQPLIAPGVCYGATDVAAAPQATLQAAQALAQTLPKGVAIVSSTLQRCERLAHCLRGLRPDLSYTTDARLVEMDFGCWEGQRWDAIPQADYDRWMAAFGEHRFGGVIRAASLVMQGVRQLEQATQWPHDAPAFGQWCELQA